VDKLNQYPHCGPDGAPNSAIASTSAAGAAALVCASVATPPIVNNADETPRFPPVVVVLGATGTGKTALAIQLALALDGEIVNADSRYFYRGMDIGTAKPTQAEQRGVPHHLLDILEPTEPFSVALYLELAYPAIDEIVGRGRLAIVVGGTPQYLRALIEGWSTPAVAPDDDLRRALEREPSDVLHRQLATLDPESAARIDPRNQRRLIRALEIVRATGAPVSASAGKAPAPYRFHVLGLRQPRDILRARVDARVRAMFAAGWLAEVERLRERGVTLDTPAMTAHGYREALAVLNQQLTIDEAIDQTQRMVRRYIRHQETWFRRFQNIHWFDTSQPDSAPAALASAREFLGAVAREL
jgi:tRNA dimethylallyltransferase